MASLNRIQLIGYVGKDPETRYTPNGSKYCRFTLGVTRRWRTAEGEAKEDTDWFNLEAWGRTGEVCQEYLAKGRLIYVEGPVRIEHYEQSGERHTYVRVIVLHMQMLDRKPGEEPVEPAAAEDEAPAG